MTSAAGPPPGGEPSGGEPSGGRFAVELGALRSDAGQWREAAEATRVHADRPGELGIYEVGLDLWTADVGLAATYDELRRTTATLLGQASEEFEAMATTLLGAADTFEREDAAGARGIDGNEPDGG